MNKTCRSCKKDKDDHLFVKNTNQCKDCRKQYITAHCKKNKEKIKAAKRAYYEKHKEKIDAYKKRYYQEHKEEIAAYKKIYRQEHKKEIRSVQNAWKKLKLANDISYKLREMVSSSIRYALKRRGSSKNKASIAQYLDISTLKQHLEQQFEPWMTWENWGKYDAKTWKDDDQSTWTWQIDHIIPQSTFNYTSMEDEDFKKCWALDNLRPYSAKQNILDGNRRKKE